MEPSIETLIMLSDVVRNLIRSHQPPGRTFSVCYDKARKSITVEFWVGEQKENDLEFVEFSSPWIIERLLIDFYRAAGYEWEADPESQAGWDAALKDLLEGGA